jgi:hypothetical protein
MLKTQSYQIFEPLRSLVMKVLLLLDMLTPPFFYILIKILCLEAKKIY